MLLPLGRRDATVNPVLCRSRTTSAAVWLFVKSPVRFAALVWKSTCPSFDTLGQLLLPFPTPEDPLLATMRLPHAFWSIATTCVKAEPLNRLGAWSANVR